MDLYLELKSIMEERLEREKAREEPHEKRRKKNRPTRRLYEDQILNNQNSN